MLSQYYDANRHKALKRHGRGRRIALVLFILLLIIALAIVIYVWLSSRTTTKSVVIKPPSSSYYSGAPVRVYDNNQFRFESTLSWQLSNEESLSGAKYVFFNTQNNIVNYELNIILDRSVQKQPVFLSKKAVNYILPVSVSGNKMKTGPMSDRCGDKIVQQNRGGQLPGTMAQTYENVSFLCDVLGSKETAAAGLMGGGYDITLPSSISGPTEVNFLFTNDTSSYFADKFKQIIESFTLK